MKSDVTDGHGDEEGRPSLGEKWVGHEASHWAAEEIFSRVPALLAGGTVSCTAGRR